MRQECMSEDTPLRKYRKDAGKTPQEMGALFGVDRATFYRWEKGDPPLPVKHLDKAVKLTGIPRHELRPDLAALFSEPAQ